MPWIHGDCPRCAELERQLREAWETILRMDAELKNLSEIVRKIEQCDAPQA